MYKDRGMQKWQGFILSEHTGMIIEEEYDYKKVPKPELDEQAYEQLGIVIMESLNYTTDIKVTYWKDGYYNVVIGVVDKVNWQLKQIKIMVDEEECMHLFIKDIVAAERI